MLDPEKFVSPDVELGQRGAALRQRTQSCELASQWNPGATTMTKINHLTRRTMLTSGIAALAALATVPALARTEGWYVIAGSHSVGDAGMRAARENAALLRRCGIQTRIADIMFSSHFRTNIIIVYQGPFRSRAEAEAALATVRPCRPDAYVKYGQFIEYH
jgi:hypothetical protein